MLTFYLKVVQYFPRGYYGDYLMKDEIKKYWKELKTGTITMFREFFKKDTNKKQRANMLTFTRLIIPIITLITSIIAIFTASIPLFIATGAIAGMGAVTDYLDGKSARKHGTSSEYGKLLDQVSDKFFAGILGINLLFINPMYIMILLGEAIIASINIAYKFKNKKLNINSTMIGRIKEWPLFITLALGFLSTINPVFLTISNTSILITTLFQLTTATSYIESNNKEIRRIKKLEKLELFNEITDKEEDKEKDKSINNFLNKDKDINNLRKKQCEELKRLKNELLNQEKNNIIDEKSFQKIKK